MLVVRNIHVRSLTPRVLYVSWEIEPTFDDVLDYDFRVMRSESPHGPFDYITEKFVDKFLFIDSSVDVETRGNRIWFYKIEITRRSTDEVLLSHPRSQSPDETLIARELRRQAMLIYSRASGRRCWLFPVRTFGQRCTYCYDPIMKQQTRSRCPQCYDTTYVRGYFDPIEIHAQFEPTPKRMTGDLVRIEKMTGQLAFMGCYPEVKPLDLLVEAENTRWVVREIHPNEMARTIVRQKLVMDEVEKGSIQFELPVKVADLMNTAFSDPFQFDPRRTLGEGITWPK